MPVAVLARYPHQTTRPPAPTARHQTRRWHLPVLPHPYRTSRDRRRPPPYRTHHHPSSRLTNLLTSCKHLARKLLKPQIPHKFPAEVGHAWEAKPSNDRHTITCPLNLLARKSQNLPKFPGEPKQISSAYQNLP